MKIVWFGGFPAHYMAKFHCGLENDFDNFYFIYSNPKPGGIDFSHQKLLLPDKYITIAPTWYSFYKAWKILNEVNPQLVLIAGNYPRLNLIAAIWATLHSKKYCYLSDTNIFDPKNNKRGIINYCLLSTLLKHAYRLLYIGTRNREFYMKICGLSASDKRLHFFPLPHPSDEFEKPIKEVTDELTFLYLGRLVAIKSVEKIIEAFSLLSQTSQRKCRLLIAGDGDRKTFLENLSTQMGVSDRVQFLGAVPSNDAPQIFSRADVVIVSSSSEPWGLVVNEALSSGKPVIAPFWVGACEDLIEHAQTGYVMEDNLPYSIFLAMEYFLQNSERIHEMGLKGRALIRNGGWNIYGSIKSVANLIDEINISKNH